MFDTAEMAIAAKAPAVAFQEALEEIRTRIKSRGEVSQVRNLITRDSIEKLNEVASEAFDDNERAVRFYGGMIHLHPQAYFTVNKPDQTKDRDTNRELGDLLLVAAFTEMDGSGNHVIKRKRGCLIQAKTSKSKKGATMTRLNLAVDATPVGTNAEQFYLLNEQPPFTLTKGGQQSYSLKHLNDPKLRPLAKYCFIWNGSKSKAPSRWDSSWQCAIPVTSAKANLALGSLLADLIECHPAAGLDFFPQASSAPNDWERLMADLTEHCSTHEWGEHSNLADPADRSFMGRIAAFATLQQHARVSDGFHYWFSEPPESFWPDASKPDGMPVLVISVASFQKPESAEPLTRMARHTAVKKAAVTLRGH